MTFDTELGDRLQASTRALPDLPDTLDDVKRRGHRRRVATRAAGAGGLAVVAVAAVAVALSVLDAPVGPIVDDPPATPTPAVTEDTTPEPSQVGTVTPGEVGWSLLVAGPDGVTRWIGDHSNVLHPSLTMTAIPLPDGGALIQEFPGNPIIRIHPDGTTRELVPARSHLRLHGVGTTADGGHVGLSTWRTGEEPDEAEFGEHLGAIDLDTGEVSDLGGSGGVESGLEHVDLVDGRLLETSCHLQCSLWSRSFPGRQEEPEPLVPADWLAQGTWFRDDIAYVGHERDPEGTILSRELVLPGRAIALPGGRWTAALSIAPDQSALLVAVGDVATDATTYLVDRLDDPTPRVRRLSVPGIARFAAVPPDSAAEAAVCRNSTDPMCGDFFWDYDVATFPNQPATITVTLEPAQPVAGEEVLVTVRIHDPDVRWPNNCGRVTARGGRYPESAHHDGDAGLPCAIADCPSRERHGPWDPPPPPQVSETEVSQLLLVWDEPGEYQIRVETDPRPLCDEFPGYLSPSVFEVTIEVVP